MAWSNKPWNASKPSFKGGIWKDRVLWYVCTHNHGEDEKAAKECGKEALAYLRRHFEVPSYYTVYER